jgi:O-antigen/teichoic acid export membrane protein
MGYLLSINIIFGYLCTYIIKLYLSHNGSTPEILGFYEVSVVVLLSYVGLIFNAMATDFYPRLTSIQNDTNKVNQLVNDQIEIGLLLCTPLIVLFYLLSPYIIKLLYSEAFFDVLLIFKAGLLAIIVKVIIWPLAFIVLAKGDKKLYFRQEIVGDLFNIGFTILFFYLFGLAGIGMATLLNYSLFGVIIYYILHSKYNFCIRKNTFKLILVSLTLGMASCLIVFYVAYPKAHFYIAIVAIFSIIYSYLELNKRIDFINIIKRKLNKF